MHLPLKRINIGYHWLKTDDCTGGIARYLKSITKKGTDAEFSFINFVYDKPWNIVFFKRFLFFFELLCPWIMSFRRKIDIYWGVAHKLPVFRIKGVRYVVTVHDLIWKVCPGTMPFMRRLIESFFFPIAVRNADVILAVSKNTADDIKKYYPAYFSKVKVTTLASSIDNLIEANSPIGIDAQKYILFVGAIEPRKNIKNMLKAYALLPKVLKQQYKLYIVYSASWGKIKINNILQELNLSSYVECRVTIKDHELIKLYKNAYCLLFPSLYEGFGLPIIEAQSFGVPVITSNISSMPEVVGAGGLLVDPHSIHNIKDALETLLNDCKLRDFLSQKAQENSRAFSWQQTYELTCRAFSQAMYNKLQNS